MDELKFVLSSHEELIIDLIFDVMAKQKFVDFTYDCPEWQSTFYLDKEQATELRDWLNNALDQL